MGSRRKGREFALEILYLLDVAPITRDKAERSYRRQVKLDAPTLEFSHNIIQGVLDSKEELDKQILAYSENWELKRMAAIDRNILRIGAYELIHEIKTPVSVIIDEAVEIAKSYSTKDSGKFVNGILDKIKNIRKKKTDDKH